MFTITQEMKKKKAASGVLPVFIPTIFNAEKILDLNVVVRSDVRVNNKAAMFYILDTLYKMSQNRYYRDYFDKYGGYPLQAKFLNKVIGKKYSSVLTLLEKSGVIKRTSGYKVGTQSKLVTLTSKYATAEVKVLSIPKDASIFRRLQQQREEYYLQNEAALANIPYITKWFDNTRIQIDPKKAHGLIEFYGIEMNSLIPVPLPKGRTEEEISSRINHRVNAMTETIRNLASGYFNLKKTGADNRLHSLVSSTKKELRGLYTYDGSPMVSVDLKASQPFLLTLLLNPKNWEPEGLISKVSPELYSKISKVKYQKLLKPILMFGTSSETLTVKGLEKTGFQTFSWGNDFYQNIVVKAKAEGGEKTFPNRAAVKQKMMMILFDDADYIDKDKGFALFSKWYPEEAALISVIKQVSRDAKTKDLDVTGLNFLPITLQRIESYLMLEKVCKQVANLLPDAPIIPVHDCIMTTEKYALQVADIAKLVLQKETGIMPGLSIEPNNPKLNKKKIIELAANDMSEILNKKPKGKHIILGLKAPILAEPPDIEGDWLIHSRYYEGGDKSDFTGKVIHLIDDITKSSFYSF